VIHAQGHRRTLRRTRSEVWHGFYRDTPIMTPIEVLGAGAGAITCPDCGGAGTVEWTDAPMECTRCKGVGKTLIACE
jgi:hypothetical protein